MSIKDKIRADYNKARVTKDEGVKRVLSVVLGDIDAQENRKGQNGPLSDNQVVKIVQKLVASNDETRGHMAPGDARRVDLAHENSVLAAYLPKEMSEQEIRDALDPLKDSIKAAKADGPAVGVAMGALKKAGLTADGGLVAKVVGEMRVP